MKGTIRSTVFPAWLLGSLFLSWVLVAQARSSQENIIVLNADGRSFTHFSGSRDSDQMTLLVPRNTKVSDYVYFFPDDVRVQRYNSDNDAFAIPSGGHSNMSTSRYKEEGEPPHFTRNANGTYTYKSWDGSYNRIDGRRYFGNWHSAGFTYYSIAWIIPPNIEVVSYKSNRDNRGKWKYRAPVLSFIASSVNNVTYEVTYRVRQADVLEAKTLP